MSHDPSYKARLHLSVSKLTSLGWPMFEAKQDKSPGTKRGFKDARVDSDQVPRWRPHAMAAHATGQEGGTVVLDLDVDLEKRLNGAKWLAQMECQHGTLPPHPITLTPRGGEHHYFKYPQGRIVRSTAGVIAPGVDVRATGGYVIVPDSENSIGCYRWKVTPWDVPPPEMPRWLLDIVAHNPSYEPNQPYSGSISANIDPDAVEREVEGKFVH